MRIVLIGLHFSEIVARLALSLAKTHDVEVHLSNFGADNELTARLREQLEAIVSVHYHPRPHRKFMFRDGFRLARHVARFRPDVVHVQEAAGWTLLAMRVFNRFRPPLVLTVHDPLPHSGADVATRARNAWANDRLRRQASAIIVHGDKLVEGMIKIEPILQGRVHSIPHGVLGQALVARALPNTGAFLFFGRIQAYKGLGVLLDAAEILVSRGLEFSLTIAGAGPDIDGLRARIARLPMVRLDERYIPADEVGAIFGNCDVVVMPYLDATQSGVAALALSAARGVIVTDVGSITEVIRNGENGLVVPPGDANALAAAMAETLSAPELRQRLAAGAAATAASALSWDHVGAETVKVYRGAVSG